MSDVDSRKAEAGSVMVKRMRVERFGMVTLLAAVALLGSCGGGADETAQETKPAAKVELPVPNDPVLAKGREVFMEFCAQCHTTGVGGSPKMTDLAKWEPRIAKGMDALNESALKGYTGPSGNEMPARGGEKTLADEDVTASVAYMMYVFETLNE